MKRRRGLRMKAESIKSRLQSLFDELDRRQDRTHALLEPLDEGVEHERMAEIYELAFDNLDDAVIDALAGLRDLIDLLGATP